MKKTTVKAIPDGMNSLTAYLTCDGASAAIAFYKKAFNAVETFRLAGKDGKIVYAMIRIGDSGLMIMDEFSEMKALGPKSLKGSPVSIYLQVQDVDAVVTQAVAAGATVHTPPTDMFWGDPRALLEDPVGHRWSVATRIRDVSPEEMREAAAKM